ncbi:MAG: hypothetical protein CME70_06010 [Halobacteriovorax sp.]|nr:hypothetical protein [Halobacteriovorax sp.]|tara:strand:+ start:884 stop:1300 length:417 start_codon:yes stop_codon:yes gene_type:complete
MKLARLRLMAGSSNIILLPPLLWDECLSHLILNSRNVELDSGVDLDTDRDIILSNSIYEDSLLQGISDDVLPSSKLQVEVFEEPLVYYSCSGDISLNSKKVELDASIKLDEDLDITFDPEGSGESLLILVDNDYTIKI